MWQQHIETKKSHNELNIILNIAIRLPVICTVLSSQQKSDFFGNSSHVEELHAIILVANLLSGPFQVTPENRGNFQFSSSPLACICMHNLWKDQR